MSSADLSFTILVSRIVSGARRSRSSSLRRPASPVWPSAMRASRCACLPCPPAGCSWVRRLPVASRAGRAGRRTSKSGVCRLDALQNPANRRRRFSVHPRLELVGNAEAFADHLHGGARAARRGSQPRTRAASTCRDGDGRDGIGEAAATSAASVNPLRAVERDEFETAPFARRSSSPAGAWLWAELTSQTFEPGEFFVRLAAS